MTPEEITLTKEQEALMIAMLTDMATADTELKQLVRCQKHVKLIWDAGQKAEREACAKVCNEVTKNHEAFFDKVPILDWLSEKCAQAIRMRK
jgi:hypothetical protein